MSGATLVLATTAFPAARLVLGLVLVVPLLQMAAPQVVAPQVAAPRPQPTAQRILVW